MSNKVYLSGPMTGLPDYNFPAFNEVEREWVDRGWAVLNPARNFSGETGHPRAEYMRIDIHSLLCADAIAMLPGWSKSQGARFELLMAQELGLDVYHAKTGRLAGLSVETFPIEVGEPIVS